MVFLFLLPVPSRSQITILGAISVLESKALEATILQQQILNEINEYFSISDVPTLLLHDLSSLEYFSFFVLDFSHPFPPIWSFLIVSVPINYFSPSFSFQLVFLTCSFFSFHCFEERDD